MPAAKAAVPDWSPMAETEKTALVLAGGGTKGAFEAGAIKYLVEEQSITPEVITATSAGSICAAVLAQARTHQELLARVRDLHDDLLAMTHTDLLFGKQPWVGALDGTLFGAAIDGCITERTRPPIPVDAAFPGDTEIASGGVSTDQSPSWRRIELAMGVLKALPRLRRARQGAEGQHRFAPHPRPAGRRPPHRWDQRDRAGRPRTRGASRGSSCAWRSPPSVPVSCVT